MRIGIETESAVHSFSGRSTGKQYFLVFGAGEARQTVAVTEEELGRLRCLIDGVLAAYTSPRLWMEAQDVTK